jgi:hypothetical protein
VALARGLSADALRAVRDGHLRAQQLTLEAGFAAREEALRRQLAEAQARAGEVQALRLHVIDSILTPKCPRCAHAFVGFNGCFALRCTPDAGDAAVDAAWAAAFCGAHFCAWCFTQCATADATHTHVAACAHNRSADGSFFGTVEQFDASLRALRVRRLRAYLAQLQPAALRPCLAAALHDDLADLGLDAQRDALLPAAAAA